jgi:probable F420-dependent oxidoreductase
MSDLDIDTMVYGLSDDIGETAALAEELGFDCVWNPEMDFDSLLPLPLVAEHTEDIEFGTKIATAFTRSPMVLAYMAWDLQRYSGGRFALGLGTQVKGHNVDRFSVDFEWESPGPRLREVVESLRHIWDVFQGRRDELNYDGEFYQFSLMTDFFDPGPIDNPDIPIHLAGVNEYNIQLAGEVADGLAMHGFNTPAYTEEVIEPLVERGAERGGRSIDEVELIAAPFVVTGRTDEEIQASREEAKERIAFYGSTRTYHDVLELHGWKGVGMELHELSKQDKWGEMHELITDEMVDAFAVEAPVDELADEIRSKYGGVADRVTVDFEGKEYWGEVVEEL